MSAKDKVFLTIPCRRGIDDAWALQGIMCPATVTPYFIDIGKGPLICNVFTGGWCRAFNSRNKGWTRWAMHHSDIQAPACWLDVMCDEMDRTGADLLGAMPCLKERSGKTSTAVYDGDTGGRRRLTLKEIHNPKLPETFDIEDLERVLGPRWGESWTGNIHLVINTGLMLWRFNEAWVEDFPGFHIDTKIGYLENGQAVPVTMAEDWNASLWASNHGLKVMATRKVTVKHHGEDVYDNSTPWGVETDSPEPFPDLV